AASVVLARAEDARPSLPGPRGAWGARGSIRKTGRDGALPAFRARSIRLTAASAASGLRTRAAALLITCVEITVVPHVVVVEPFHEPSPLRRWAAPCRFLQDRPRRLIPYVC